MRTVPGFIKMELFVEGLLFDVGQDEHAPTQKRLALFAVHDGRREPAMLIGVVVHGQPELD